MAETRNVVFIRNYTMSHWRRTARRTECHPVETELANNLEKRGIVRSCMNDESPIQGSPTLAASPEKAAVAPPAGTPEKPKEQATK
jgi:hypothetical protein